MIKQNDIALIILIISFTLVVSWFAAGSVINSPDNRSQTVEVVRPISSDFALPPTSVFNDDAINPTELIQIGEGDNEKPFIDGNAN